MKRIKQTPPKIYTFNINVTKTRTESKFQKNYFEQPTALYTSDTTKFYLLEFPADVINEEDIGDHLHND